MKTIEEKNRLIGVFNGDIKSIDANVSFNRNCVPSKFEYHISWDWLIPVVEMIESLGYLIDIFGKAISIHHKDGEIIVDNPESSADTKFQAIYNACYQFIEWYNENKNV